MFTTVAHRPNRWAVCRTMSGSSTAAVLMLTFSAPAWTSAVTSSIVRIPPPTVKGMKHCSATCRTMSYVICRFSWLAVMSRNTNSSAPASS